MDYSQCSRCIICFHWQKCVTFFISLRLNKNSLCLPQTPSGGQMESTANANGTYDLLLKSPFRGGNYTCRFPPSSAAELCLPRDAPLLEGTTLQVSKMEASLSLMQATNSRLADRLNTLSMKLDTLTEENELLKNELLCKQSGEPLEQPSGQCGNSTIGWLLQEKTGQALGSTSFNVRPRMPSLNCDINDLFGPTEANSSFCHKWSDWHHPHTTEANQFQFWEPEHGPVIGRIWILYHQSQSQSQRAERDQSKSATTLSMQSDCYW